MEKICLKVVSIAVLICLVFSLSACGIIYEHEFIRSDLFFILDENERNYIFNSHEEMAQFLADTIDEIETRNDFSLEYNLETLNTLFEKYDEAFFETNILVLVSIAEGSGSTRHKLKSVGFSSDTITINIKRIIPKIGTDDMAYWHLFLTVPKRDFDGNTVRAIFE